MSRASDHTLVGSDASARHSRYTDSTHLIPTRILDKKKPRPYDPLIMNIIICVGTALNMMAIGIALEVGLGISARNNGFSVPQRNVISFVTPQFLLSFFPTLFVIPIAFLWREIDWMMRWYQPYVVLSRGRATAEESLLLDCTCGYFVPITLSTVTLTLRQIALGTFFSLFRALKYKHRIVFFSALTAAITYIFQPLAGAIFQLRQMNIESDMTVNSTRQIGLAPDINQLNDFLAAAGFAEARVAHNLSDPPFVKDGWATAEFQIPSYPGFNGSLAVNTTGVQTTTSCVTPSSFNLTQDTEAGTFRYTASSPNSCTATTTINISSSNAQYGVIPVSSCPGASANVTFQPVLFWFFHHRSDNTPEARGVFCSPSINTSSVVATVDLESNTMTSCLSQGSAPPLPLEGSYNGLIFSFSPDRQDEVTNPDPFISARATSIKAGVPGAIFRLASANGPAGLQTVFDTPNGFRDLTDTVYKQHLALSAKAVYFVPANDVLNAKRWSDVTRLWIDPLPGHLLAFLLFLVGFVGVVIHILGRRARRRLVLCAPPGSIAAVMALTSRSGFGELLLPYDDEKTLEKKLDGLRFKLDERTGAIVADEKGFYEFGGGSQGVDDAMMSLLGGPKSASTKGGDDLDTYAYSESSSRLAQQAAAGYPPWVTRAG